MIGTISFLWMEATCKRHWTTNHYKHVLLDNVLMPTRQMFYGLEGLQIAAVPAAEALGEICPRIWVCSGIHCRG